MFIGPSSYFLWYNPLMSKTKTEVSFVERNGRTFSKRIVYHDNGQIAEIGLYANSLESWSWDIPSGVVRKYFRDGQLEAEIVYDEQGTRDGESLFYDSHGKLIRKVIYLQDRKVEEITYEDNEDQGF